MKYQANSTALSQSTDCLIIGIYENNEFTKSFNEIDQITQGYLSQLAQSQDLQAKLVKRLCFIRYQILPLNAC